MYIQTQNINQIIIIMLVIIDIRKDAILINSVVYHFILTKRNSYIHLLSIIH